MNPARTPTDKLLEQIGHGPKGPHIAAIFDFDGTLIDGYSATALYAHRLRNFEVGAAEAVRTVRATLGGTLTEAEFTELIAGGVRGWQGRLEEDLIELGERLFAQEVAGSLFHEAWRLVKAHQRRGHTIIIATSATRLQVLPLANELGVEHVLCTRLERDNGVLTGRIEGRPLWGEGKAAAVRAFADEHAIDLANSHAYANGNEDIPLLESVGTPHPVNPQPELATVAARSGWPALEFGTSRHRLDPTPAARTAAMYGSLFAAAGAGIALGVLRGDRRLGVDLATSVFGDVAGALGDLRLEVIGEHHVWSQRPAVFFINHQSTLIDFVVTSRLLRHGFTAVAKKELQRTPLIGQLFSMAGVAFVDRADRNSAVESLRPAVDTLKMGTSVVMAPEGTRSLTPRLGPFKKGGFHLAAQAGVPIVPIVIRNAGEIMWRGAKTAKSGTIQVVVHPPIPTEGWTTDDIDGAVHDVRQLYLDTLDDWPTGHATEVNR